MKDTLGAGDSFLAILLADLLKKKLPQDVLNHAWAIVALVFASEGTNPKLDSEMVRNFMDPAVL